MPDQWEEMPCHSENVFPEFRQRLPKTSGFVVVIPLQISNLSIFMSVVMTAGQHLTFGRSIRRLLLRWQIAISTTS